MIAQTSTQGERDTWRDYDWVGLAEKAGIALIILIVTWIEARLVKAGFTKLVGRAKFLQRQSSDGQSLGAALGQIALLLVWLFGAPRAPSPPRVGARAASGGGARAASRDLPLGRPGQGSAPHTPSRVLPAVQSLAQVASRRPGPRLTKR
ncbi:hypothetical protein [Serinicoccus marinus]|uniref:hypothetical protein n=1 Tax=Serinicoccus marinus TaxID=247333 RepID=UPI0013760B2F|nr:hypothetical protein [Serinicoccus marinus]